ncbi:MAG: hypothetical protein CL561_00235 [Alphaproteobacteria bacterium]|nr:hypothetical protein [Alphaproteobacteria bacterium]|tara:strand:- start:40036 stop:40806 length:771 start_codon:yes stop_codon:yes gene_type:complete
MKDIAENETLPLKANENVPAVMPDQVLEMIERVASNPDADVSKLEKIMDLQERMLNRDAETAFNIDMAKLREELPPIIKNKRNNQTNSNYADLAEIKKTVDPLLSKYGFYDRYEDEFLDGNMIRTTCEIVHRQGHSKRNTVQFALDDKGIKGSVNKTSIHASASSMSYGQRISLCRALGVRIAEDDDGNGSGQEPISIEIAADIDSRINKLTDANEYKNKFLGYMKVNAIQEIPKGKLSKALTALRAKEERGHENS